MSPGDNVTAGQKLAVLEEMKMQYETFAEIDGKVTDVHIKADILLKADTIMTELEKKGRLNQSRFVDTTPIILGLNVAPSPIEDL